MKLAKLWTVLLRLNLCRTKEGKVRHVVPAFFGPQRRKLRTRKSTQDPVTIDIAEKGGLSQGKGVEFVGTESIDKENAKSASLEQQDAYDPISEDEIDKRSLKLSNLRRSKLMQKKKWTLGKMLEKEKENKEEEEVEKEKENEREKKNAEVGKEVEVEKERNEKKIEQKEEERIEIEKGEVAEKQKDLASAPQESESNK
ncbi:LOW QUALITY PROTEIN: hypothetical protein M9H77_12676 [Catharanthus roseus]|uniref:Uncharacterized protein n=1 Tax=Catharanthus roseus TaxID=4058 RepID=A0ACC0BI88_CATRO|nr:LOW QUALITY PROTEIN: hypothetical protein M9H77_12676 [Catharanthus roseus]